MMESPENRALNMSTVTEEVLTSQIKYLSEELQRSRTEREERLGKLTDENFRLSAELSDKKGTIFALELLKNRLEAGKESDKSIQRELERKLGAAEGEIRQLRAAREEDKMKINDLEGSLAKANEMAKQKSDELEAIKEENKRLTILVENLEKTQRFDQVGGGDNESGEGRQNKGLQTARDGEDNNGFSENEEQLGEAANTGGNPETSSSEYDNEEEASNEVEDDEESSEEEGVDISAVGSSMEDTMIASKTDDKQQDLNLRKNGCSQSAPGTGSHKQSSPERPQSPRRSSRRQVIARRQVAARRQSEPRHDQNKRTRIQSSPRSNDNVKTATRSSKRISMSTKRKHDSSEEDEETDIVKVFACTKCSSRFSRHDSLTRHMRRCHGQESYGGFGCSNCASIFQTFNHLCEHRRAVHNSTETTGTSRERKDSEVSSAADSVAQESEHGYPPGFNANRKVSKYPCKCGLSYANKYSLDRHLNTMESPRIFRCPFFCTTFSTVYNLNRHVRRTHKLANFKCFGCRKCGTIFKHQKALDEHSANAH